MVLKVFLKYFVCFHNACNYKVYKYTYHIYFFRKEIKKFKIPLLIPPLYLNTIDLSEIFWFKNSIPLYLVFCCCLFL